MIHKMRRYCTKHMLTVLINAYVNSVTDYCITIWAPSRVSDFKCIQNKVNQLLAIISYPKLAKYYNKSYWKESSCSDDVNVKKVECRKLHQKINYYDLWEDFNLLTITERLKYYSLWNMYKILKFGCNVIQISAMFNIVSASNSQASQRSTRNSQNCIVLDHKTSLFEKSIQYYSVKLWNSLPAQIKDFAQSKINVHDAINEWILNSRSKYLFISLG